MLLVLNLKTTRESALGSMPLRTEEWVAQIACLVLLPDYSTKNSFLGMQQIGL